MHTSTRFYMAVVLSLVVACSGGNSPGKDGDCGACPPGRICVKGECVTLCNSQANCGTCENCETGACIADLACQADPCFSVSCDTTERCAAGTCWPVNCSTSTCGVAEACVQEQCVDVSCVGEECAGMCANGEWPATLYRDNDGDGYGAMTISGEACEVPLGFVVVSGDCNDGDPNMKPGLPEICNGVDTDCNSVVDDGACPTIAYYCDVDLDGVIAGTPTASCDTFECVPSGCQSAKGGDCDDNNPLISPNKLERCNLADDNCDTQVDEGGVCLNAYYCDNDQDGFVSSASDGTGVVPAGCIGVAGTDCRDDVFEINTTATEICNGVDDDCDTEVDEGGLCSFIYYCDGDNDTHIADTNAGNCATFGCVPAGCVTDVGTDCDDGNPLVFTGATEVCNAVDDDCNTEIDEIATPLLNDAHTDCDCINAGGSAAAAGTDSICRFWLTGCPASWTRHQSWGSTSQRTCGSPNGTYCTTGSHGWSSAGQEVCLWDACDRPSMCGGKRTCTATLSSVGCY